MMPRHLMHTKMRPLSTAAVNKVNQMEIPPERNSTEKIRPRESIDCAISMDKIEILDAALGDSSQPFQLLLTVALEYDLDRIQVRELIKKYIGLELPIGEKATQQNSGHQEELSLSAFYKIEQNSSHALKPNYENLYLAVRWISRR